MKKFLFFLLKNLLLIQRISLILLFLTLSVGIFLIIYIFIGNQELIFSHLTILLPGAYFLCELLLLSLYYSIIILERYHELDLKQINSKQPIAFAKLSRLEKNKYNIYIGNLRCFWSKEPDFFNVQYVKKVKFMDLFISLILLISWLSFYENNLWALVGILGALFIIIMFIREYIYSII